MLLRYFSNLPGILTVALLIQSRVVTPDSAMEAAVLYTQDQPFATRHVEEIHRKLYPRPVQRQKRFQRSVICDIEDLIGFVASTPRSH